MTLLSSDLHNRSRRNRLIAMVVAALIAAAGAGLTVFHGVLSSPRDGQLVLVAAGDTGANAFTPPAALPPPTDFQPQSTLKFQGSAVATQPMLGDRDGLYGGTVNTTEIDRDKLIDFLTAHPAQASAFLETLNADTTLYWTGGRRLNADDIPTYLHELTPAALRLDTRITDHRFDGAHPTTVQSVFQAGTSVLVDGHGVPRVRGLSGNPLTAPIALSGEQRVAGAPWPAYRPGALADIRPSNTAIRDFVLVDVVTGQPFNRLAGTAGSDDTPHTQLVASPGAAARALHSEAQTPGRSIDGTYLLTFLTSTCGGTGTYTVTISHRGNTLTIASAYYRTMKGPLNPDGSFSVSDPGYPVTERGVLATEGGRVIIRDGTFQHVACAGTWEATQQRTATQ